MEARRTATALVLFLCTAFLLWWAATSLETSSTVVHKTNESASLSSVLIVRHSVENDAHRYSGTIASSGCEALATGIQAEGTDPTNLTVKFSRMEASEECPSALSSANTEQPFLIAVATKDGEPVVKEITVDGKAVAFSVIEE